MSMKMKDGKNMNGKVYVGGGKMRQEFNAEGHDVIQIVATIPTTPARNRMR
jgi:hypothetical protein